LTKLVLASVEKTQMGVSAGINSAVTRIGALASTALLGDTLAHRGPRLMTDFRHAAIAGTIACAAAAAAAAYVHE
jgi:hypothetical protein